MTEHWESGDYLEQEGAYIDEEDYPEENPDEQYEEIKFNELENERKNI